MSIQSLVDKSKKLVDDTKKLADKPQIKNSIQAGKDAGKAYKSTRSAVESVKSIKSIKDVKGAFESVKDAGESIGTAVSGAKTAVKSFKKGGGEQVEEAGDQDVAAASSQAAVGNEWDWESQTSQPSEKEASSSEKKGAVKDKKSKKKGGLVGKAQALYDNVMDIAESDGVKGLVESGESVAKHGEAAFNSGKDAYETGKGAWEAAQGAWKSFGSGGSLKDAVSAGKEIIGAGKDIGKAVKSGKSAFGEAKATYGEAKDTLIQAKAVVGDIVGSKKGGSEAGAVEGDAAEAKADAKDGESKPADVAKEGKSDKKEAKTAAGGKGKVKSSKKASGKKKSSGGKAAAKGGASGGGAAPAPKGKGSGKNAVDAFANSGLSYQIENYGGLGADVTQEVQKGKDEINAKTPGVKNVQPKNKAVDDAIDAKIEGSKKLNSALKVSESKAKFSGDTGKVSETLKAKIEMMKAQTKQSKEELPDTPEIEVDMSNLDAQQAEAEQEISSTMAEAEGIVASIDKTMPKRGVDDIQSPKLVVEGEVKNIDSEALAVEDDIASLDDEGKGLLDSSDEGKQLQAQMAEQKAMANQADAKHQADTAQIIAENEQNVKKQIATMEAEQEAIVAKQQAEIDKEVADKTAAMNSELSAINAENKQAVAETRGKINAKKLETSKKISIAKKKAQNDKKNAEKEAKKKEGDEKKNRVSKGLDWVADKAKAVVDSVCDWLKDRFNAIVGAFTEVACGLMDGFAVVVGVFNKDLGNKLKASTDKAKKTVRDLSKKLCDSVGNLIDAGRKLAHAQIDAGIGMIQAVCFNDTSRLELAQRELAEAKELAVKGLKGLLELVGDVFKIVVRAACKLAGIAKEVAERIIESAAKIVKQSFLFVKTLFKGIKEGFVNFVKPGHLWENLKAVAVNLINIWFSSLDAQLDSFTVPSLIKFLLQIVGIDVDTILSHLGLKEVYEEYVKEKTYIKDDEEPKQSEQTQTTASSAENASADVVSGGGGSGFREGDSTAKGDDRDTLSPAQRELFDNLKKDGVKAFVPYLKDNIGTIVMNVVQSTLIEIGKELLKKGIEKLAEVLTPVGGIVAAIKAVWGMWTFISTNLSRLTGLIRGILSVLSKAAEGDSSAVAKAVEASLCQVIPLLIELILQLCGINIGSYITKYISKWKRMVTAWFGRSKVGMAIRKRKNKSKAKASKKIEKGVEKYSGAETIKKIGEGEKTKATMSWGYGAAKKIDGMKNKMQVISDAGIFNIGDLGDTLEGKRVGNSFAFTERDIAYRMYVKKNGLDKAKSQKDFNKAYDEVMADYKVNRSFRRPGVGNVREDMEAVDQYMATKSHNKKVMNQHRIENGETIANGNVQKTIQDTSDAIIDGKFAKNWKNGLYGKGNKSFKDMMFGKDRDEKTKIKDGKRKIYKPGDVYENKDGYKCTVKAGHYIVVNEDGSVAYHGTDKNFADQIYIKGAEARNVAGGVV